MQRLDGINLVIVSGSNEVQECLHDVFMTLGANVVLCGFLDLSFVNQLECDIKADVILIEMCDAFEEDEEALDQLIETINIPLLFNENTQLDESNDIEMHCGFSVQAIEKLAFKLFKLAQSSKAEQLLDNDEEKTERIVLDAYEEEEKTEQIIFQVQEDEEEKTERIIVQLEDEEEKTERIVFQSKKGTSCADLGNIGDARVTEKAPELNVWVLGASIGGPESIKNFLSNIPKDLPVAFVLAQHLGEGFSSLLAAQLDRTSSFNVKEAQDGDALKHGQVCVVPIASRITITTAGRIKFIQEHWQGFYKPSIDCVINDVTKVFKKNAGVIIFSGMGIDGLKACQLFFDQYDGLIWAEGSDSCVISSMPDSIRENNLAEYSGSPRALALKITKKYQNNQEVVRVDSTHECTVNVSK